VNMASDFYNGEPKSQHISIDAICKLLSMKLVSQAWLFDCIERNNGYFPYPIFLKKYFEKLGVEHWADFYFEEKINVAIKEVRSECDFLTEYIYEKFGPNPTNEQVIAGLKELSEEIADESVGLEFLEFLGSNPDIDQLAILTQEEKDNQKNVLMSFQIGFYNDLSVAIHGESIVVLVQKAVSQLDLDAFSKAIQIDRTILPYFFKLIEQKQLVGDSNFFDTVAYRIRNPPTRGKIKHPLLWILFKDLFHFKCLRRDITSKQILDLYNDAVSEFPQFLIEDEQIVRRQRQQFLKKYRLLK
jgi:hypothetical protein